MRNIYLMPILLVSAVALSACNTAAPSNYWSYYWGPPQYGAPWGPPPGKVVEVFTSPSPMYIDGGGMDPVTRNIAPPTGRIEVIVPPEGPSDWPGSSGHHTPEHALAPSYSGANLVGKPTKSAASPAPEHHPRMVSAPAHAASYTGTWRVEGGSGARCRISLSSTSSIDLYRASSSGCANPALKSVNTWNFKDNTVTLYSRGTVVARLSGAEADLSGSLGNGGGAIRMTR